MERTEINYSNLAGQLNEEFASLTLNERLERVGAIASRAIFTTSLGMEDQVLTRAIAISAQPIRLATLQTGRLFAETESLIQITRDRYSLEIKEYKPDKESLLAYAEQFGKDGFYNSVEARKACCNIRKLVPLAAALSGADVWITGLRRQQSVARSEVAFVEWDGERGLLKVNPLADWSGDQIKKAIADHDIPVNPLHDLGYPSIGCAPCTRAIKPGEDERAGRWWWEQQDTKECGLHVAEAEPDVSEIRLSERDYSLAPKGLSGHA